MTNLLEYQAKALFREVGIPILPSQRIDNPADLKRLDLPYPLVLKSQVRAGGRGKLGGVRFVDNTIDAIAAARAIFNLPIHGERPQVLLAEARYNPDRELFVAVAIDFQLQRPVLLGSPEGGIEMETVLERMEQVVVEDDFSPYYGRRLALKMGLQGAQMQAVSDIVARLYQLLVAKDLNSVEINPLGLNADGSVVALDGKIQVNDSAIARHPELAAIAPERAAHPFPESLYPFDWSQASGNIGIIGNCLSLSLAAWDLLATAGSEVGKVWIVSLTDEETAVAETLRQTFQEAIVNKHIDVVLVNILSAPERTKLVAKAIAETLAATNAQTQWVIRLADRDPSEIARQLETSSLAWTDDLDEAIAMAVSRSQSPTLDGSQ